MSSVAFIVSYNFLMMGSPMKRVNQVEVIVTLITSSLIDICLGIEFLFGQQTQYYRLYYLDPIPFKAPTIFCYHPCVHNCNAYNVCKASKSLKLYGCLIIMYVNNAIYNIIFYACKYSPNLRMKQVYEGSFEAKFYLTFSMTSINIRDLHYMIKASP